jgi:hypothetical protein
VELEQYQGRRSNVALSIFRLGEFYMKKSKTKVEGNVIGRVGQRTDEGKASPSGGSSAVGKKWGFIPAPANGSPKHHPMGHKNGVDGSGSKDSGKGNQHSSKYGRHPLDARKTDNLSK